jgi:hypothetical protein
VALPVVVRHFHADATAANWIVLSYMLVNTVLILVFGGSRTSSAAAGCTSPA